MEAFDFHWKMMDAMVRIKGQAETIVHPYCMAHSLTPGQLRVLMTLYFEGETNVRTLARRTCMADANNSAVCKKLEQMGYVARRRDPEDERLVLVSLSPLGEQRVLGVRAACDEQYGRLAEFITQEDAELITAGLDRLLSIMESHKETLHEE